MMVACSNEDLTQQTQTKAGKMQFSATIAAPSSGATTRTIYTEDTQNKKITVAWKVGDEIALVHNKVKDVATVKTINSDGSATITGYVTGATNNADVRLVYPAARVGTVTGGADGTEYTADETVEGKLKTQDGTLVYIQDNLDFREDMGQLAVSETGVTLAEKAGDISPLLAIWKLTLSDGTNNLSATQVKIKGGESVLASTTTLATATSVVTLAIPTDVYIDGALTIEATVGDDTYAYTKAEGATFNPGTYYQSTVTMANAWDGNLATVTKNVTATDGTTIYGTLGKNVMISIADGATVTLDGVDINATGTWTTGNYAGITCLGDATIILKDGTENTVKGFYDEYPGIHPAVGKTLTIKGTGSLTASSNGFGTGIGGGFSINCGNIIIEGGTITATGGQYAAAIGSGGNGGSCGAITITSGVTSVTATKGASAPNSIGAGKNGTCGTVTIGCTLNNDGNPVGGTTGAISTSPYTYDPSAPAAWAANEYNEASWDNTNSKVVYTKNSATNYGVVSSKTSSNIIWDSAWLTVSGNVTLTGTVRLTQDVHLILQDGATLTITGILKCDSYSLYIYGQGKGDGKLNVKKDEGSAIQGNAGSSNIEIHGGEITVEASSNGIKIDGIKVYGGKLTATSSGAHGIYGFGNFEVYGGEVEATAGGSRSSDGISVFSTLIVYGGKVKGTGINDGYGIGCKVQSGTSGIKFYFSDDNSNWGDGNSYANPTDAQRKRYAKAE